MHDLQKTLKLKENKGINWYFNYFNEYNFLEMRSLARSFTFSLRQIWKMLVKKVFATLCFSHADHALIFFFSHTKNILICISHTVTTTMYVIVIQPHQPRSIYYVVFQSQLPCMYLCFSPFTVYDCITNVDGAKSKTTYPVSTEIFSDHEIEM